MAGKGKIHNEKPVQAKTLALADGVLKKELAAAKLDRLSLTPVQERGKPLRHVKPGPHYLEGALAAYNVFREHRDAVVRRKGIAV
ncbi:MAG: hypothetical protein ACE5OS_04795 [Anaerolineae bacterium]